MALLVPDVGDIRLLSYGLNKLAPEDQILKLFKSNTTPADGDVAGTYTEADFTGYASVSLAGASWTVTNLGGGVIEASYAQQTFTSSADQTTQLVYGYYVVGASSGILLWAERFTNGPYAIAVNTDNIKVTPKIQAD